MKGNAILTVEIALNGVDLRLTEGFVEYVRSELPNVLHQQVTAMPGVDATVRAVVWTPDQEK